jgi:hypothetical protein
MSCNGTNTRGVLDMFCHHLALDVTVSGSADAGSDGPGSASRQVSRAGAYGVPAWLKRRVLGHPCFPFGVPAWFPRSRPLG